MNLEFRQILIVELQHLKDDFCLLWILRNNNPVKYPLLVLVDKMRKLKNLLSHHPEIKCPHCKKSIN